jgi:hypothetical protein
MEKSKAVGTAYSDMTGPQKVKWILKVVVCVCTLGMVFPNVMAE